MPKQIPSSIFYGVCALITIGALPIPSYVYYKFLRIVAFLFFSFGAYLTFNASEKGFWPWLYLFLAILFNPIYPIGFPKVVWVPIDLAVAVLMLLRRRDWLGSNEAESSSPHVLPVKPTEVQPNSHSLLALDVAKHEVRCNDITLKLEPTPFALYLLLAQHQAKGKGAIDLTDDQIIEGYFSIYERLVGTSSPRLKKARLTYGRDTVSFVEYSRSRISTINTLIQKKATDIDVEPFLIRPTKQAKKTVYSLSITPENIRFS